MEVAVPGEGAVFGDRVYVAVNSVAVMSIYVSGPPTTADFPFRARMLWFSWLCA